MEREGEREREKERERASKIIDLQPRLTAAGGTHLLLYRGIGPELERSKVNIPSSQLELTTKSDTAKAIIQGWRFAS